MNAVDGLVEASTALLDWIRVNEPERLNKPGWRRLSAAVAAVQADAAAGLSDPSAPAVALHNEATDTERAAAYEVLPRSGSQRERVLHFVSANPAGVTDFEIADGTGLEASSVRPRRGELVEGGWLEDSGERRLSPSGHPAIVWRVSRAGRWRLIEAERDALEV